MPGNHAQLPTAVPDHTTERSVGTGFGWYCGQSPGLLVASRTVVRDDRAMPSPSVPSPLFESVSPATDHCVVTEAALVPADFEALVAASDRGATVGFAGIVRDHDHGRAVADLEYVGHPSAESFLRKAVAAVAAEYPSCAITAAHRVGRLAIGEVALVVAVGAAHRGEAFACCAAAVDRIKAEVPVWKRQTFRDGTSEWVACGSSAATV